MKRHRVLEPFSRDHNHGLILARALMEGRAGALERMRLAWTEELEDHFREEEQILGPLLTPELRAKLTHDHQEIERMLHTESQPAALGVALHDHIRWEERVLFPYLEANLSEPELAKIGSQTWPIETRRWARDPQRERLVKRRTQAG